LSADDSLLLNQVPLKIFFRFESLIFTYEFIAQ